MSKSFLIAANERLSHVTFTNPDAFAKITRVSGCADKLLGFIKATPGLQENFDVIRDRGLCAHCQQPAETLRVCSRCNGPEYCSKSCQKEAWRGGHKLNCLTREQKVSKVMESLIARGDAQRVCTTQLANAALEVTGDRIWAAIVVVLRCQPDPSGRMLSLVSDEDFCMALQHLIDSRRGRRALAPAALVRLTELAQTSRADMSAEDQRFEDQREVLQDLAEECQGPILDKLLELIPGLTIDIPENCKDLSEWRATSAEERIEKVIVLSAIYCIYSSRNIPAFCALAETVLESPCWPLLTQRFRRKIVEVKIRAVKQMLHKVWLRFGQSMGMGDQTTSDDEMVALVRETELRNRGANVSSLAHLDSLQQTWDKNHNAAQGAGWRSFG